MLPLNVLKFTPPPMNESHHQSIKFFPTQKKKKNLFLQKCCHNVVIM